jgi:hypothetical protein
VSLFLEGNVFDTTTPLVVSRFSGHIDATFSDKSVADLVAAFAPGGAGFIQTAFSGSKFAIFSPVPEPMTLLTFGAGTAILAARRRRKAQVS